YGHCYADAPQALCLMFARFYVFVFADADRDYRSARLLHPPAVLLVCFRGKVHAVTPSDKPHKLPGARRI
ncbi:MAG TPA: hypothetical protein VJH55_01540, partial [Candidatus Paceibacterota bacterium]